MCETPSGEIVKYEKIAILKLKKYFKNFWKKFLELLPLNWALDFEKIKCEIWKKYEIFTFEMKKLL